MRVLDALGHALSLAGSMTWQITWSLILGFTLAAVIQALIRRETVTRLLGDDRPRTLALAAGLGAASSSCSYAAVALARSLFRKGASFTAAMVFEIASTNLVIELGIILALLISWQFTLAEFAGGAIMIVLVAVAFRLFVRQRLIEAARDQAGKGLAGSMEGHAAMDMSIAAGGPFWRRLISRDGVTSVSHIFVMEWAAVIRDIIVGLLIAGAAGAWVPDSLWRHLFLAGHPLAAKLWGPVIGPVISVLSFVCSIGNVPLAGVLWKGGISFGGVAAFIFADLIIIPILVIYRKYYGTKMMLAILGIFYATMAAAGYLIEFAFGGLGLVPARRTAKVTVSGIQWNYTTVLNIIFLLLAAALLARFFRSGGRPMLKMMGGSPGGHDHQAHADSQRHARASAQPAYEPSHAAVPERKHMLITEARIQTERPGRYLVQICRHFSNKGRHLRHRPRSHGTGDTQALSAGQAHVEWSGTSGTVSFPAGQCAMQAAGSELILRAEASDEETLHQIQELLTGHLTRFSRRDHLTVTWQQAETLTAQPGEPG